MNADITLQTRSDEVIQVSDEDLSSSRPKTDDVLDHREQLWDLHPVVRWDETFAIATPMLDGVSDIISQSIFSKRSGRGFYGPPCYGKTTAMVHLTRQIHRVYPRVAVVRMEATEAKRPTELEFYGDLLDAADYRLRKLRPAHERRSQLVNFLWTIATNLDDYRLVLFIDEAQNISISEWAWLKSVQNLLRWQGVWLIVFPFGQEALLHVRSALRAAGRMDLVKRFMRSLYCFEGVKTEQQLLQVLRGFDAQARFPIPDGPYYSQFFFPRAFAAGWRLQSETPRFWLALRSERPVGLKPDIGMEWIAIAIQYFLTEYSDQDAVGWEGTDALWKAAVGASDLHLDELDAVA